MRIEKQYINSEKIRPYIFQAMELSKSFGEGRWNLLLGSLPSVLYAAKGNLEGKKVLDLACGSKETSYSGLVSYEPWLCRTLYELGLEPIGVDINNNSDEEFENYKVDLTDSHSLEFLPSHSVDIANASGLFTLPFIDVDQLKANIVPQLERIVKPDGIFIYEDLTSSLL
jgi:SAM-dependent methyltransferase